MLFLMGSIIPFISKVSNSQSLNLSKSFTFTLISHQLPNFLYSRVHITSTVFTFEIDDADPIFVEFVGLNHCFFLNIIKVSFNDSENPRKLYQ